jgi:Trk K+ transport system NAD-binding subunit/nucleotide-binding universal stress UspA family protein
MKPEVLIVGAGETGSQLARRLHEHWAVTVVDVDPEALEQELLNGCQVLTGDGTSALVLRRAGADNARTLVATTGDDESNLEVLRVGQRDFGIEELYASMATAGSEERYRELGVEVVDRHMSCSALLEARLERRTVATNIGLGEGEIMEVEVLANSSVIGRSLADLSPRRWLVGAVYRDGQLIVPHGDTVIEEGDRVLIIGEPAVLSSIATHIGSGESEFPLHYGSKVVALCSPGLEGLLGEINYLLDSTAAQHFEVIAGPGTTLDPAVTRCCDASGFALEFINTEDPSPLSLADEAARRDVGILAVEPRPLSFWCRIGLARSDTVKLIDLFSSPVLVARGTHPYRRVVLSLAELPFPVSATQLAIDLARMIDASLTLVVVHQPELVVGGQLREEMEERRRQVVKLAGLYHLPVEVEVLEGNPIEVMTARSGDCDLMVVPYRRRRRSSLTNPDVGQNLIHRARCSVLVMPD